VHWLVTRGFFILLSCASFEDLLEMSSASALIDLGLEHRVDSVEVGQVFPSMACATAFLQDYNFNRDKSIKKSSRGGKNATYKCSDSNCSWNAVLYRRKCSGGANEYHVTALNDHHSDSCTSFGKASRRQLKLLKTFSSAVAANKAVSRRHVQHLLQERDGVNTHLQKSTIYRARHELVAENDVE
jgi:hypothetical protein